MRLKGDPLPNQVLFLEKVVSFVQSSVVWQSGERQSSQNESSPINTLAKKKFGYRQKSFNQWVNFFVSSYMQQPEACQSQIFAKLSPK